MAPHKALLIPDILHEIFKHLAPCPQLSLPDEDLGSFEFPANMPSFDLRRDICKTRRLTLAHAARACKAFADPASRVLWEVLDEIEPILSVLRVTQKSDGQVDAAGWARFEDVCRRIRALSFTARPSEAMGDMLSLIFKLSHRHGGAASFKFQFPNLRALEVWWEVWHDEDPDPEIESLLLKAFASLCASPSLALLCLPAITEDHLDVLYTIGAACTPRLLHLRVPDVGDLHTDAGRILGPFTSLQTAAFGRIDREMLLLLGSLTSLRKLEGEFVVDPVNDQTIGSAVTKTALFSALRELTTSDRDADVHLPAMLSLMSSDALSLTVLSLRICTESSEGMLRYLDDTLPSPALASLHELSIRVEIDRRPMFGIFPNGQWPQDQPLADDPVSFADVLPFLKRLPALRCISFTVEFRTTASATAFDVCDADLAAVAETWPHLVRLTVVHANWRSSSRRPSLSALVTLAERCRNLESIDVEFDSVGADELARLEARAAACTQAGTALPQPQTALRQIVVNVNIGGGPRLEYDGRDLEYHRTLRVTEPSRLAVALRTLFPNLRSGLGELLLEEQERRCPALREHCLGCRMGCEVTDMGSETDAVRLLKALDDVHPHPRLGRRAAANLNIAPRKALEIVTLIGLLVTVMVARLRLVEDLNLGSFVLRPESSGVKERTLRAIDFRDVAGDQNSHQFPTIQSDRPTGDTVLQNPQHSIVFCEL